jgi:spermidine/putrescine transport system permease protein
MKQTRITRFWGRLALLTPSLGWIFAFLVLPLGLMAYISTLARGPMGGVIWNRHTADAYIQFLFERDLMDNLVVNTDYLRIFVRSIAIAGITTIITLVIAFPTALWMAFLPPKRRLLMLFIVTVPFWTNILVRNYAWILLLRTGGVIDTALRAIGLTHEPFSILYTPLATGIGLTYSFLPYMVLPIYVSLEKLDRRLVEAAFDLGAGRWQAFRRVILPLTMPGVTAGAILVFVPGLGAFISPELLGGKSMMIGSLIQMQFGQARNWPFGAALAFVLFALVLLALGAHAWRYRRTAP